MLAYEFSNALYIHGHVIPTDIVEQLSLANLYGWMAYEIYDDVLDGEGDPSLIPCANFFLRTLTGTYSSLAVNIPKVMPLFKEMMNRIDNANSWEQKYCRAAPGGVIPRELPPFADHQTLADRSIGHAMGPLAELLGAGYDADSGEKRHATSFFRHYLIARQLHDDAHDWADDLMCGRINSVGALVLSRFKELYPRDAATQAINKIFPKLREFFWKKMIDEVTHVIVFHTAEARRAQQASAILDGADFMENAIRAFESGARQAVKERDEVLIFLNDYKGFSASGAQP